MRQRGLHVRDAGRENRIVLMVVARLEHKFLPVIGVHAVLEQIVEPGWVIGPVALDHGLLQQGDPICPAGTDQNVRRRDRSCLSAPVTIACSTRIGLPECTGSVPSERPLPDAPEEHGECPLESR